MVSNAKSSSAPEARRVLQVRPGLGLALQVVQGSGRPLWRVFVEFPTLILVRAGSKRLRREGREIVVREGEMLALAGGCEVEVTNALPASGPYIGQSLSIDPALCAEVESLGRRLTPVADAQVIPQPSVHVRAAFARGLVACDPLAGPPEPIARHHLHEMLLALAVDGWRFDLSGLARVSARLRRLLGAEATRRWKAGAAARQLGMSEATLRRKLEKEGTTFRRVLQEVRMGRALVLLQSSELPVVQVAFEVGYESVSQFTTRFRRHFGQSPRQLRAQPLA